jgi:hypothetical protein
MSDTPTYDRLRERVTAQVAFYRHAGAPIPNATYALMRELSGRAITSGQRAGERAANNVFDAFVRKYGYGVRPTSEVYERASKMAGVASARARERHAVKLVREGRA